MELVTYDGSRKAEWDAFVAAHPLSSYGHLSATFALAAVSGAANHSLLLYDERRLQAVLPLFVLRDHDLRAIPIVTLRSGLGFPAGPLFVTTSPKVRERHLGALVHEALAIGARTACDRVRIGYPTVAGRQLAIDCYHYLPLRDFGFSETNVVSLVLDFEREPRPERVATYACRQSLRRAEEIGASVGTITDPAVWRACHELNVQTMGALAYTAEQMEVIWREFIEPGVATAYACRVEGVISSVIVSIHGPTSSYYWLGFNRRPAMRGTAHLALATAIREAANRGAKFFELGSKEFTNARQMNISRFKESFGGTPCYALDGILERKRIKKLVLDFAHLAVAAVRPASQPGAAAAAAE